MKFIITSPTLEFLKLHAQIPGRIHWRYLTRDTPWKLVHVGVTQNKGGGPIPWKCYTFSRKPSGVLRSRLHYDRLLVTTRLLTTHKSIMIIRIHSYKSICGQFSRTQPPQEYMFWKGRLFSDSLFSGAMLVSEEGGSLSGQTFRASTKWGKFLRSLLIVP